MNVKKRFPPLLFPPLSHRPGEPRWMQKPAPVITLTQGCRARVLQSRLFVRRELYRTVFEKHAPALHSPLQSSGGDARAGHAVTDEEAREGRRAASAVTRC